MNREIKFRGKATNGDWVYGNLAKTIEQQGCDEECCIIPYDNSHTLGGVDFIEIYPDTIGQFTGLKDKNGVEIYEGDIVNATLCGLSYVSFLPQECGFVLVTKNSDYRITGCYKVAHCVEVIGNIHDNPELLKGGQE